MNRSSRPARSPYSSVRIAACRWNIKEREKTWLDHNIATTSSSARIAKRGFFVREKGDPFVYEAVRLRLEHALPPQSRCHRRRDPGRRGLDLEKVRHLVNAVQF